MNNQLTRRYSLSLPLHTSMIFDAPSNKKLVLEKHFNDIHLMFLRELANFSIKAESTQEEHERLNKLLQELIKVREALQGK